MDLLKLPASKIPALNDHYAGLMTVCYAKGSRCLLFEEMALENIRRRFDP